MSLTKLIFNPVKNPRTPSFWYILTIASPIPLYSLNPTTSNLVFTTIRGFANIDYIVFVNTPDKSWT